MLQRRDHAAGTGARGPCLTEGSQRAHALAARQSTARRPRDRCAARLHRRAPRRATCLQRGQTLPPQGRTSTRAQQVWGRNRGSRKMGRKESWRKRHEERERERERERTCVCVCVLNMQTGRIATLVSQEAKGRTVPVFPTKQRVPWPNPSTVTRLPTSLWVKMDATACSTALVMEVRAPKAT